MAENAPLNKVIAFFFVLPYKDFIHLIISVLSTGTQKEKTEAYCLLKVCAVDRDGSEGSELGLTPSLPKTHAVWGEGLVIRATQARPCHRKANLCFHTVPIWKDFHRYLILGI